MCCKKHLWPLVTQLHSVQVRISLGQAHPCDKLIPPHRQNLFYEGLLKNYVDYLKTKLVNDGLLNILMDGFKNIFHFKGLSELQIVLKIIQKTKIGSLVGLKGLCATIIHLNVYKNILRYK